MDTLSDFPQLRSKNRTGAWLGPDPLLSLQRRRYEDRPSLGLPVSRLESSGFFRTGCSGNLH